MGSGASKRKNSGRTSTHNAPGSANDVYPPVNEPGVVHEEGTAFSFHEEQLKRRIELIGTVAHMHTSIKKRSSREQALVDTNKWSFERFQEVSLSMPVEGILTPEIIEVCRALSVICENRHRYLFPHVPIDSFDISEMEIPKKMENTSVEMKQGLITIIRNDNELVCPITREMYWKDLHYLMRHSANGPLKSFCYQRIKVLESLHGLYRLLNSEVEEQATRLDVADFYSVCKVDNHVHLAAAMSARDLLLFLRSKFYNEPERPAIMKKGNLYTLGGILKELHLDASDITVDTLDVHADSNLFNRFDKFNSKYNPMGNSDLRTIFLKTDNYMNGVYLAEIVKRLLNSMEGVPNPPHDGKSSTKQECTFQEGAEMAMKLCGKYSIQSPLELKNMISEERIELSSVEKESVLSFLEGITQTSTKHVKCGEDPTILAEYRVSIYGRKKDEWTKLASWIIDNDLLSEVNMWMIQVPRIYPVFKKLGLIENFEEMIGNIFMPLFEVTIHPESDPVLYKFLTQLSGFDSVDDESGRDNHNEDILPHEWTEAKNPGYAYWLYYMYANIYTLNILRKERGLNTFTFRPHCGESGTSDHLASAFLTADNIQHGINLRVSPALEYLYFLEQIGIAVSPLSNNSLFLDYQKNPFPHFFNVGLRVTLTTDDPLLFHLSQEPLLEEYSIASKVWKLNTTDLSEIARNSVLISGFPHDRKKKFLSDNYYKGGVAGNNQHFSNLPDIRVHYRMEQLKRERDFISKGKSKWKKLN